MNKTIKRAALDGDLMAVQRIVEQIEADEKLMRQALEALQRHQEFTRPITETSATIRAIKERLA